MKKLGRLSAALILPATPSACTSMPAREPQVDREKIRAVLLSHMHEVRKCYETQLTVDPKLAGKIVLRWEIEGAGHVANASVDPKSTIQNKELNRCLLERLRTWDFPPAPTGKTVEISYPYFFSN